MELDMVADPTSGGLVVLTSGTIERLTLDGISATVVVYTPQSDPASLQAPLGAVPRMNTALAVAPDGTIFMSGAGDGKILAIKDGQIRTFATTKTVMWTLAVDSKGNLHGAPYLSKQIYRIPEGGSPQSVFSSTSNVNIRGFRFDAQDRLYIYAAGCN